MDTRPIKRYAGGVREILRHNRELCHNILLNITPLISLQIQDSAVPGERIGLLVREDLPEGAEIIRSSPLLSFTGWDGQVRWQELICAQCYRFSKRNIHPSRNLNMFLPPKEVVRLRTGCGSCGYCSEVSLKLIRCELVNDYLLGL
jgi:hypothetical protein